MQRMKKDSERKGGHGGGGGGGEGTPTSPSYYPALFPSFSFPSFSFPCVFLMSVWNQFNTCLSCVHSNFARFLISDTFSLTLDTNPFQEPRERAFCQRQHQTHGQKSWAGNEVRLNETLLGGHMPRFLLQTSWNKMMENYWNMPSSV